MKSDQIVKCRRIGRDGAQCSVATCAHRLATEAGGSRIDTGVAAGFHVLLGGFREGDDHRTVE